MQKEDVVIEITLSVALGIREKHKMNKKNHIFESNDYSS